MQSFSNHSINPYSHTGAISLFIGLLGTFWGIYHALIAISSSESAQIRSSCWPHW
ncbi:MotA/TolQ/ExbB proton channel family protein [Polynucleobacter necessarius]|uniref:MotA/TolQ/ExbB proton channel family protein n=1 Tax=Polynucleobacter necessarius TaxID=576610 RepID=UPI0039E4C507